MGLPRDFKRKKRERFVTEASVFLMVTKRKVYFAPAPPLGGNLGVKGPLEMSVAESV